MPCMSHMYIYIYILYMRYTVYLYTVRKEMYSPVGCLLWDPMKNQEPQNHLECIELGVSMDRCFQFLSMIQAIFESPRLQPGVFPSPTWNVTFKDYGSGVKRGFVGLHDQWLTRGWNLVARWRCCDLCPADQKQVRLDSLRFNQIKTVYLRLGLEHELVFGIPIIIFQAMSSLKNRFVLL